MSDTKTCPYCGEEILTSAKKCRYCGEWLDKSAQVTDVTTRNTEVSTTNADDDSAKEELLNEMGFSNGSETAGMLWGCGWRLALAALVIWFVCANVPNYEDHSKAIHDDARDCIRDKGASAVDFVIPGLGTLLSSFADNETINTGLDELFDLRNKITVDEGWFWSTGYIVNESYPKGTAVSFGICGIVFPFVSWDDIRILSDKTKDELINGKDNSGNDDDDNASDNATTVEEDAAVSSDEELSSSQISDWSMIEPVKLGSDEAYAEWQDSHTNMLHQTAHGSIDGNPISIDIVHDNDHMVGRYHSNSLSLDLNGTSIDDVMYLQLGHGSETSHAVLWKDSNMEHTWRGTWGRSEKRMELVFSD